MTWRLSTQEIFNNYPKEANKSLRDVYEFGVYTGESVHDIKNILDNAGLHCKSFYCFDSFIGLPEEQNEKIAQKGWEKGGFNASEKLGVSTVEECITKVDSIVRNHANFSDCKLHWVPGFFNESLTECNRENLNMGPALYVDIDADLYTSTLEALDFMFRQQLIVPGTIIGYDDWGGTPGWFICKDGEARAHKEICDKYKVVTQKICQFGNKFPHVQTMFLVRSIG
jgi:hypothetical protein